MKITTILGSPTKKGNTATVLGRAEKLISHQHEVDRIDIIDHDVRGCRGCGACRKNPDEPACVQKDDAEAIFQRLLAADAIVYASPLYCWSFTAQLKALIDRHICLVKGYGTSEYKSLIDGKPLALLITCAGPVKQNVDLLPQLFDRMAAYLKCPVAGKYIVPGCTTPDALGEEAEKVARKLAEGILTAPWG